MLREKWWFSSFRLLLIYRPQPFHVILLDFLPSFLLIFFFIYTAMSDHRLIRNLINYCINVLYLVIKLSSAHLRWQDDLIFIVVTIFFDHSIPTLRWSLPPVLDLILLTSPTFNVLLSLLESTIILRWVDAVSRRSHSRAFSWWLHHFIPRLCILPTYIISWVMHLPLAVPGKTHTGGFANIWFLVSKHSLLLEDRLRGAGTYWLFFVALVGILDCL